MQPDKIRRSQARINAECRQHEEEEKKMPLYCVNDQGKVCVMVQDTKKPCKAGYEWVYIPERKWDRMTEEQRKRYIP